MSDVERKKQKHIWSSGDPNAVQKKKISEKKQTTCILCNKQCDEDKSGFPLDAWNCMQEKAIKLQGKNKILVLHVGVSS